MPEAVSGKCPLWNVLSGKRRAVLLIFYKKQLTRKLTRIKLLKREIEIDTAVLPAFSKGDAEHPVCGGIGGIR